MEATLMAKAAALGLWEFVFGDDWQAAVGVVAMLCTTATIAAAGWDPPALICA